MMLSANESNLFLLLGKGNHALIMHDHTFSEPHDVLGVSAKNLIRINIMMNMS